MSTATAPARTIRICPECQADNDSQSKRCWACLGDMSDSQEVVFADIVAEPAARTSIAKGRIIELIVLAVGVLVLGGAFTQSTGLGIGLALVWVVALLAIFFTRPGLRNSLRESPPAAAVTGGSYYAESQEPVPPGVLTPRITPASEVVRQVLVTLGVVFLIMFAAFIALCVACFALIFAETAGHP